jgi:hypothetical protein
MNMIVVRREDWNNSRPVVNGRPIAIPLDRPFDASAELIEVLTNAEIPFAGYTEPGDLDGSVTILPIAQNPQPVPVVVNGTLTRLPVGVRLMLSASVIAVLDAALIAYRRNREGGEAPAPTPTPTPTPTLIASPNPASFTIGSAPGTLIATIGNVPLGAELSISPNDGRAVAMGNQVFVGLTASSAGTIEYTISAPGSASVVLTVNALEPGALMPMSMQSSIDFQDVTYLFYDDGGSPTTAMVGRYADGQPCVLATPGKRFRTNTPSVTIAASFTGGRIETNGSTTTGTYNQSFRANGLMKDPFFFTGTYDDEEQLPGSPAVQGFDERFQYYANDGAPSAAACQPYSSAANIDPGATGVDVPLTVGSYVKCISRVGMTSPTPWRQVEQTPTSPGFSVLHVVSEQPALGALAPGCSDLNKSSYLFTTSMNKAALGDGFPLPAGKPTLAECEAAGSFPYSFLPHFAWGGEARRRVMPDFPGSNSGYSRDFGQAFNDYITAIRAVGQTIDDAYLVRALAVGAQLIGMYNRGFLNRGGAGQNSGFRQFTMLLGFVFKDVPGLFAKCIAYEGSATHQYAEMIADYVGKQNPYPNGNHYTFGTPVRDSDVGRHLWFHGGLAIPPLNLPTNFSSEFNADYSVVANVANFGEQLNIGGYKNGLEGKDGSEILAQYFPSVLPAMDFYREVIPEIYTGAVRTARETAHYDALRSTFAVPRQGMTPDSASQVSGVTSAAGGFSWDYGAMAHSFPAPTAAETEYSMDGIQWSNAATGLTGSVSGLVPGWRYYTRRRRQNSVGWGPRSVPFGAGNQAVASRITASTTAGSRTLTVTAVNSANGPIRLGDHVAGVGIVPGTYIAAFGTGAGGKDVAALGTYTLSTPADATIATTLRYTFPPVATVTPTGTPSGAVTWAVDPALYVPRYPIYQGPLFQALADGASLNVDSIVYCGMGIATGNVLPPTYQWFRDGAAISGATAARYRLVGADRGTTLRCDVTSNGVTRSSNAVAVPGVVYPAFSLVANNSAYLRRLAAFSGLVNSRKLTIGIAVQLFGSDTAVLPLFRFGDSTAGTASNNNVVQLDRNAQGRLFLTVRDSATGTVLTATSATGSANGFVQADGEQIIAISIDVDAGLITASKGNATVAMSLGSTNSNPINLAGMARNFLLATIAGGATHSAHLRYAFLHPDYLDLSVEANRTKLLPANIGNQGQALFGGPLTMFVYGGADDWNAGTNFGSGGNFERVGGPMVAA